MKLRLLISSLVCLCALLLAACASDGSISSAADPTTPGSSASTSRLVVRPTPTPGLVAHNVLITLTSFAIHSTRTTFVKGVHYHFTIVNNSSALHEFMIISPHMSAMAMDNMATMDRMALTHISGIKPKQRVTLDFTFPQNAPAGTLEFACHLPGHYEANMKLGIVVGKAA